MNQENNLQKKIIYAILKKYSKEGKKLMSLMWVIVYILILVIFYLIIFAIFQIRSAGMKVKDFWSFIKANETLDKLYRFAKKYEKLSPQEQVIFLAEAEKVFSAFEKVPDMLWEEEYNKYMEVLNKYKDIRVLRWTSN